MHTRKLLYSGSLVLNSITIGQRESDNINCMIGIRKSPAHEKCFILFGNLVKPGEFDHISLMITLSVIIKATSAVV